jgi:hypothetical protein
MRPDQLHSTYPPLPQQIALCSPLLDFDGLRSDIIDIETRLPLLSLSETTMHRIAYISDALAQVLKLDLVACRERCSPPPCGRTFGTLPSSSSSPRQHTSRARCSRAFPPQMCI